MLWLVIGAVLGVGYVGMTLRTWRHRAAERWAWTEWANSPRVSYYRAQQKRPDGALWSPGDSRLMVAIESLFMAALWPLVGAHGVLEHVAVLVTRPTKAERRRRQLAAAKERVARLERELGIGGDRCS